MSFGLMYFFLYFTHVLEKNTLSDKFWRFYKWIYVKDSDSYFFWALLECLQGEKKYLYCPTLLKEALHVLKYAWKQQKILAS